MLAGRDPINAETSGNLNALYGRKILISLDAKIEDGNPPDETGYGWWVYDSSDNLWYKNLEDVGNTPGDWTHYEETIDTTWSNAEAQANGWYSLNSNRNWQELMQDVKQWNFMGRALDYRGGGSYTGHLDNFLMESIMPQPGDANLDGTVDEADATILAANWQRNDDVYWQEGDFNGDGTVDDADATVLAANWQGSSSQSADVPEPALYVLLLSLLTCIAVCKCRFRRPT